MTWAVTCEIYRFKYYDVSYINILSRVIVNFDALLVMFTADND